MAQKVTKELRVGEFSRPRIPQEVIAMIEKYRAFLVSGDQKRIATELDKTQQYVSGVMNGKYLNYDVIEKIKQRAILNAAKAGVQL
jgi:hypothetical protein